MEKVTGMMRQEEKSSRDHLETVICMSLEEMEWSISIAEQEEDQECGDVIFLIVMVYSRASTSTLALLQQVFGCVCGGHCVFIANCPQVGCHQQSSPSLWSLRLMRILLSSLSHVRVEEDQSQRWSGGEME